MTDEQAIRLRALIFDALQKTLGKSMAFVVIAQEESGAIEVLTNAARKDLLPELLEEAAGMVRAPGTVTRLS